MNKISLLLASLTLGLTTLTPATAEAGGCRTRVTYDSCGRTLHWEYRFVGYDCHRCPIYRWVVVRTCAPAPRYDYDHGHGHGGYHGSYGGHDRYPSRGGSCRR